ncbi:hypothetical protein [[Enterobacter] lignolyticus]|uniref:Inner membrane protein n=1 Tax=Enterobacter lignolyticus (strain SCF1) TaxID=701347 RepID=E3GD52_ENTLS|nr:hypothetical protein [[Enterobacter] lignolyticus]ADO49071.1 putative inner membrane protein [[Enterobacter] lignolyticus SCF1]
MTKYLTSLYLLLFLITGISLTWFYHIWKSKPYDRETCAISSVVFQGDKRADISIVFTYELKLKTGVVSISGTYSRDNKVIGLIRRDVSYTWTENKDSFQFYSVKTAKIANNDTISDAELSELVPDFYVYPQRKILYSILDQGPRGYLFTIGKRPVFFCVKL